MQGLLKRTATRTTTTKKYIFLSKKFLHQNHLVSGEKKRKRIVIPKRANLLFLYLQ